MTASPNEPRETVPVAPVPPVDDLSIVPGLGPVPDDAPADVPDVTSGVPAPRAEAPTRLDPALDPDRYDPARDAAAFAPPLGGLDPALDPDRYHPDLDPAREVPPGQGQTLPDLLGEGAYEDKRDNYQWAIGLLGVLVFLALVSWIFGSVVSY